MGYECCSGNPRNRLKKKENEHVDHLSHGADNSNLENIENRENEPKQIYKNEPISYNGNNFCNNEKINKTIRDNYDYELFENNANNINNDAINNNKNEVQLSQNIPSQNESSLSIGNTLSNTQILENSLEMSTKIINNQPLVKKNENSLDESTRSFSYFPSETNISYLEPNKPITFVKQEIKYPVMIDYRENTKESNKDTNSKRNNIIHRSVAQSCADLQHPIPEYDSISYRMNYSVNPSN